jgi:hypothetical protein
VAINFIPNDPLAGSAAPALRSQAKRPNRPASRASFTLVNSSPEGTAQPGTPAFLFWQCREAGLAALGAWESFAGQFTRWQGNRKKLPLLQDDGVDVNAFYDRRSFSFFHRMIGNGTVFSGASTDVVAHEVGHGLLDAIRPELWDAPFLEAGAFHEAFGDCVAILTALGDRDTRVKLLASAPSLKKKNFVESTAEELSDAIRRLIPTHNAAEPRHAFNDFQFVIPETLPDDGGPGELINEVHSFGMLFSGSFYDLIAAIFTAETTKTEAKLLSAARTAGALLVEGARTAVITPRFFQSVGRAMVLADEVKNGGANRDRIRNAFLRHNIMLGANTLLAPVAALAGDAPTLGRKPKLGAKARKDLAARLGVKAGARLAIDTAEIAGQRFARVTHKQEVSLGPVSSRLKGVSVTADVPVMVGDSGGRAAVVGNLPETVSTEREVHAFVESLLNHNQIELSSAPRAKGAAARGAVGRTKKAVSRETHRIRVVGRKKVLERVRFHCRCCR